MVAAQPPSSLTQTNGLPTQLDSSLQQFKDAPIENSEWVDGQIIKKVGMTAKHGVVQGWLG